MTDSPVLVNSFSVTVEITINRPQCRNSLTAETITLLRSAFDSVSSNPNARCVLFSGKGSEAFCAGADLTQLASSQSPSDRRVFFDSIASLIESMVQCPVPIVAMVHGFALAGGCGLAAACDLTLAADDAQFGLPEVAIGLAPMVVMAPIVRAIGPKHTAHLALTGERISATQALAYGLINEVVAKGDLEKRARAVCETIAAQSPAAIRTTKAALLDVTEREYPAFMHELADRSAILSVGDEAREGVAAFSEKRPPAWRLPPQTPGKA
jgi:enoyl-CoA hydratase/carnithine racemase